MNTKNLRKRDNPELWEYQYGSFMFSAGEAFGQKTDKFPHSGIIDRWTAVLKRVEKHNKTT